MRDYLMRSGSGIPQVMSETDQARDASNQDKSRLGSSQVKTVGCRSGQAMTSGF